MTIINELIQKLNNIHQLYLSLPNLEKSNQDEVKKDISKSFQECFQSYQDIKHVINNQTLSTNKDHAELHVLIGEIAYESEHYEISRVIIESILQLEIQQNQYYCRAKLVLALLINYESSSTNGTEALRWHKYAINEVMLALDIAIHIKNNNRYKFLVFNISVVGWTIIHPYLRTTRAKTFVNELKRIATALEDQDDIDKDWRIMLLSAVALCSEDDKNVANATEFVDKAILHMDSLLQITIAEENKLLNELKVISTEKDKIMKAFREIEDQEILRNKPEKIDPDKPPKDPNLPKTPRILPPLIGLANEGYEKVKVLLDESLVNKSIIDQKIKVIQDKKNNQLEYIMKLFLQRIQVNPNDSKRYTALPIVTSRNIRIQTLIQLQTILSNAITEKDWDGILQGLIKKLKDSPVSLIRSETLADLSKGCWRLNKHNLAIEAYEYALQGNIVSKVLRMKLDLCDSFKAISDLALLENQTKGTTHINGRVNQRLSFKQTEGYYTSQRLDIIKSFERSLQACIELNNDHYLIQEICIYMWNQMISFFQSHLRSKVHNSLKVMAKALKTVASPLSLLRTEVHYELAKCEEQSKAITSARDEIKAALYCDYGDINAGLNATLEAGKDIGLDRNRALDHMLLPYLNALEVRCLVYDTPTTAEDQAIQWLQAAEESKLKPYINEMITKALYLLLDYFDIEQDIINNNNNSSRGAKKNAVGSLDFVGYIASKKQPLLIPELSLTQLTEIVSLPYKEISDIKQYEKFSPILQKRLHIMYGIAKLGHAVENVLVCQQAIYFILHRSWNLSDPFMREMIDAQIHVHYLLAENLLVRIKNIPFSNTVAMKDTGIDPRCLGYHSDEMHEDIKILKSLVIKFLDRGISCSLVLKDSFAIQNGFIYFWNLHVAIFRQGLYNQCIEEILPFLLNTLSVFDNLLASPTTQITGSTIKVQSFDYRLRLTLLETLVEYYECHSQLPDAIQMATKGTVPKCGVDPTVIPEYYRKKLCEATSRLTLLQAGATGGGKGGKGGSGEAPKFSSAFLNVFAIIAQAEQPVDIIPKEQSIALTQKALEMLEKEVKLELESQDLTSLTQERFSQLIELQIEAWTRITRLRVLFGDTIGAQYTAEKGLALVNVTKDQHLVSGNSALTAQDSYYLNPRVWRWASLCESMLGLAIEAIIQPSGQALSLQYDLRIVTLEHFVVSCEYGLKANNDSLVVEAATRAWNISISIVKVTAIRNKLYPLQRKVVTSLITSYNQSNPILKESIDKLLQQYYLAIVEGFATINDWDKAYSYIMEAFTYVSVKLQKPLWQWRVIVMSKKGKSVLDGLQKLKEGDVSLQAQVYGNLARASSNIPQQLESYVSAIDILHNEMERVDYILEVSQWMASKGIPKNQIIDMIKQALDALYEVEEQSIPDIADLDEDEAGLLLLTSNHHHHHNSIDQEGSYEHKSNHNHAHIPSSTSVQSMVVSTSRTAGGKKPFTATSSVASINAKTKTCLTKRGSTHTAGPGEVEEEKLPKRLDFKMLEQLCRSLIMLNILETKHTIRIERYLQVVFYIQKQLELWMNTLYEIYKYNLYNQLKPEEKDGTIDKPDISLDNFNPVKPEYLKIPEEPIIFLSQLCAKNQCDSQILELMKIAFEKYPTDIPSATSLPCLQLTIHYYMHLASELHQLGYMKYALYVYALIRMLMMYIYPHIPEGCEAMLCVCHFKCIQIFMEMGLEKEGLALSDKLPITSISVGNYLRNFVNDFVLETQQSTIKTNTEKDSEVINMFGLIPLTVDLARTFGMVSTIPFYLLQVCDSLIYHGYVSQCENLVLCLQKLFLCTNHIRANLHCVRLIAKIQYLQGKYENVISLILSKRGDMELVGDAFELSQHTQLLVQAYIKIDNIEDAKQISLLTMQLLEDMSMKLIDVHNKKDTKAIKDTAKKTTSTRGINTAVSTSQSKRTANGSNLVIEMSLMNASSLSHLIQTCYSEVTYLEIIHNTTTTNEDPRALYSTYVDKVDLLIDLLIDITGELSPISIDILVCKALFCAKILLYIYTNGSNLINPIEELKPWLSEQLLNCVQTLEKAIDLRKQILQQLPHNEYYYTPLTQDQQVKESSTGNISLAPYVHISNPNQRKLASNQASLGYLLVQLGSILHEHISENTTTSISLTDNLTAVERYLEETKPLHDCQYTDFIIPRLTKASLLLNESSRNYLSTDNVNEIELLRITALLYFQLGKGAFDYMWSVPITPKTTTLTITPTTGKPIKNDVIASTKVSESLSIQANTTTNNAYVPTIIEDIERHVNKDMLLLRTSLLEKIKLCYQEIGLNSEIPSRYLSNAIVSIVDSYGRVNSAMASLWLMQLQSLTTTNWLRDVWRNYSLSNTSTIAFSSNILEELQHCRDWPERYRNVVKKAEQEYCMKSSVAYQRLSITMDPMEIIKMCPSNIMYCCLQYCPYKDIFYVCAGIRTPSQDTVGDTAKGTSKKPANTSTTDVPGMEDKYWIIDRVVLSENQRRSMQVILKQHNLWLTESAKFISSSGESFPSDFDLEGSTSKYESKSVRKTEGALEEKLRALLADLEICFESILGNESKVMLFMKDLIEQHHKATTTSTTTKNNTSNSKLSCLLLIDSSLQSLPWEGLSCMSIFEGRVSRDFSIHMLHHRLQSALTTTNTTDASTIIIPASSFKYVIDPLEEDSGNNLDGYHRNSLKESFSLLLKDKVVGGMEKWIPIRKDKGLVSLQDFIFSLNKSTQSSTGIAPPISLFSHSLGRMSSIFPPIEVANLNLQAILLYLCLDQGHNDQSTRRQLSADVIKSNREIQSENMLHYAAILALSGVNSSIHQSWSIPVSAQHRFIKCLLKIFTTDPSSVVNSSNNIELLNALAMTNNYNLYEPQSKHTIRSKSLFLQGAIKINRDTLQVVDNEQQSNNNSYGIKKWIKLSRILYGIPHITYNNNL